jgi:replicative DNA helicase
MSGSYNGLGNGKGGQNGSGPARAGRPEVVALGDRLPPQNIEAEQGVLGSILLDNDVLHDIIPILGVADFYRDTHQIIYETIRDLYDDGRAIDGVTLADELIRRDQFQKIGGDETLKEMVDSVPHAANGKYYANIVREKSISRQLIDGATEIIRDGYSRQYTAAELLEAAERKIYNIAQDQVQGTTLELKDVVHEAMDAIAARADSGGHTVTGLASGLADLDEITSGFQAGQLVVLAARPSMGKTALALNICDHVAIGLTMPVLFISLEMGNLEIAERLLCARSRVDGHKLRTGMGMGNREMAQLARAYTELRSGQIFIDDTPARNMLQITRAVESREDRRPRMADLRESGAIEQDADIVLLLHRPEYYDANDQPGIAELIVAKNRNGRTDTLKLTFLKSLMRFENLAAVAEPIDEGNPF